MSDPRDRVLLEMARRLAVIDGKLDELLARRDELAPPLPNGEWVDARALARRYGLKPEWFRHRKLELGGQAVGSGSRPRLRFNLEYVERQMPRLLAEQPEPEPSPPPRRRPRRPRGGAELLPIKGGRSDGGWPNVASHQSGPAFAPIEPGP